MKKMKGSVSDETIGIKDHKEMDMGSAQCADKKYLGGEDPSEYSLDQQNAMAKTIRKYGTPPNGW